MHEHKSWERLREVLAIYDTREKRQLHVYLFETLESADMVKCCYVLITTNVLLLFLYRL